MGLKTYYGVQPFWHDGRRLARGDLQQFRTEVEATRAAERLYDNHAGVLVYSVTGDPDYDAWQEPRTIATLGSVPLYAAMT